jgi:hypothetical protein
MPHSSRSRSKLTGLARRADRSARRAAIAMTAVTMSLAPTAPSAAAAPAAPSAAAAPAAPPIGAASWTASTTGPWRLPTPGRQIAFLDARHAVVRPRAEGLANRLMTVELATGAVSPALAVVGETATIHQLVRIGHRLLAFGIDDEAPAAWEFSLPAQPGAELTATSITVPPGHVGRVADDVPIVAVSPDERWLIWCHAASPPTLREAATLRVVRELDVASCKRPTFSSNDRVVLGDQEVELPTGTVRLAKEQRRIAGPRGRVLETQGPYRQLAIVTEGKRVLQQLFEIDDELRWTPDGVAVSLTRAALSLRPGPGGEPRTVRPRLVFSYRRDFAVSSSLALILDGAALEAVDLTSGESRGPAGNTAAIAAIVPFDGGLAAASDRLRLWRAGAVAAEENVELTSLRATRTRVVAVDQSLLVWLWDPPSGQRRVLGQADAIIDPMLTTAGDDVWFSTSYTLEHSTAGSPARTLARFRLGLTPVAFEPRGRLALLEDPELLHVADLAAGRARTWHLGLFCSVLPDGLTAGRLYLQSLSKLHVVDLDGGRPTSTIELPSDEGQQLAITPGGDVVLATGAKLMLWSPGEAKLLAWPVPIPEGATISALRLSADGSVAALGYSTGAVALVPLAEVRKSGVAQPIELTEDPCLVGAPKATTFLSLGLTLPAGSPPATPASPTAPRAPAPAAVPAQNKVGVGAPAARSSSAFKNPPIKTDSTDR